MKVLTLKAENQSLKQELSAMDPKFFEEVEDLKYAYQQVGVCICVTLANHLVYSDEFWCTHVAQSRADVFILVYDFTKAPRKSGSQAS